MTKQTQVIDQVTKEVSTMNKTQVRSALARKHSVTLTPQEFKETSLALLRCKLIELELEATPITIKGDVDMTMATTNNNNIKDEAKQMNNTKTNTIKGDDVMTNKTNTGAVDMVKVQAVADLMKKYAAQQAEATAVTIQNESVKVLIPAIQATGASVVEQLQKDLADIKAKMQELVSRPVVQPETQTPKKPLSPTVLASCAVCGFGIKSPDVIKYSTENYGKPVCFTCQKAGKATKIANTTKSAKAKIAVKCTTCNEVLKLTMDQIIATKANAVSKGLPEGVYHPACGAKALAELANTNNTLILDNTPDVSSDVMFDEDGNQIDMSTLSKEAPATNTTNNAATNGVQFNPTKEDIAANNNTAAF